MDKVFPSVDAAVADIPDGACVAIGGFFTAGTPIDLIQALTRQGAKELTIICMQMGPGNEVISDLILNKQIKKAICNYPFYRSASRGADSPCEQAVRAGELEMQVFPMGTFSEKLRAGGAGIAAFYTPTGVGTVVESGKEKRKFGDRDYILEMSLKPDYAFIYGYRGDGMGNIQCHLTARNFSPEMAAAAKITIAAVESIVEPGKINGDAVHIPGIYVQRVVKVNRPSYFPTIE